MHDLALEVKVRFIRAVLAILFPVVDPVVGNFFAVVARPHVVATVVVGVAAEQVAKDISKRIFERLLKVLLNGFSEGLTGLSQNVPHHDEHHGVSGRARLARCGVDGCAVSEVDGEGFIRAQVELDVVHACIAFVVALTCEFVVDDDVELPRVKSEFFGGQAGELKVVVRGAAVGSGDGTAVVPHLGLAAFVMDCDLRGIVCAVPRSVLVLSRFDVDWTGVAQAPKGVRIDGITEVDAAGEVDAQFLAAALKDHIDGEVCVVADGHLESHVCTHQLVSVVEVLGVEDVHGQDVLGDGLNVDVKRSGIGLAETRGFRPIGHEHGVGDKAVAKNHIAGAAPDLMCVALVVLNGLHADVFRLVNVHVAGTGGQLPDVKVEPGIVGIRHDFSEQFLDVQTGHVLQIAVKAGPVVFHAVVVLRGFGGNGLHHRNGRECCEQKEGHEQAGGCSSQRGHGPLLSTIPYNASGCGFRGF